MTGSEDNSHKFSCAYNTGRMWRAHRDARPDARLAKRLRAAFVRRYCRATTVTVPLSLCADLPRLETAVKALAPLGMLDWNDKRSFVPEIEPTILAAALLNDLRFSSHQRTGVELQAALHTQLTRA